MQKGAGKGLCATPCPGMHTTHTTRCTAATAPSDPEVHDLLCCALHELQPLLEAVTLPGHLLVLIQQPPQLWLLLAWGVVAREGGGGGGSRTWQ
jgi:hypothetical protein